MGKRLVGLAQLQQMMRMREEGYSYNQISIAMKIPVATVHYNVNNPAPTGLDVRQLCGTSYGYSQHLKRGEQACLLCCDAHAQQKRDDRNRPILKEADRFQREVLDKLDI